MHFPTLECISHPSIIRPVVHAVVRFSVPHSLFVSRHVCLLSRYYLAKINLRAFFFVSELFRFFASIVIFISLLMLWYGIDSYVTSHTTVCIACETNSSEWKAHQTNKDRCTKHDSGQSNCVAHQCERRKENGKVLRPITSAHESNLNNNYSNLHCEKQVSSDDERE